MRTEAEVKEENRKLTTESIANLILSSPYNDSPGEIVKLEGKEDHLEITIKCDDGTKWMHSIYTEEV